jgi:hypothetical protein
VQRVHQRRRVQQERPVRKVDVALTDRRQVVFGERSLESKLKDFRNIFAENNWRKKLPILTINTESKNV